MRKLAAATAGLAALLAIAALIVPFIVGFKVEATFHHDVARLAQRINQSPLIDVPIRIVDYQRGWFSSRATTRLGQGRCAVNIESDIVHGPYRVFGWARVHSVPKLCRRMREQVRRYTDKPPLSATTIIGFSGDVQLTLRSPELGQPVKGPSGVTIDWRGLTATYKNDGRRNHLTLDAPLFRLKDNDRRIVLESLALRASGFNTGAIIANPEQADLWRSQASLTLDRFRWADLNEPFDLKGQLRFDSDSASSDDGLVHFTEVLKLADARLAGPSLPGDKPVNIDAATLEVSLQGIKAKPLAELLAGLRQRVREAARSGDAGAINGRLTSLFFRYGPRLIADRARFIVAVPSLAAADGQAKARLITQLTAAGDRSLQAGALGLIQRLNITLKAGADQTLVQSWLARFTSLAAADRRLALLTRQGMLVPKDDRYRFLLSYENGQTRVNGRDADGLGLALLQLMR